MKQVVQQLVKIHNHILIYTIILQVEMLKFRFLFPNSEGAIDAAQLCYDELTYFNLTYWNYRVDSCNYINWYISIPEDASVFQTDSIPLIWITLYNKNGEIIQQTAQQLHQQPYFSIQPQITDMPSQINGQVPYVYYEYTEDEQIVIIIPSRVIVLSIDVQETELINYTTDSQNGIIIRVQYSESFNININYCQVSGQEQYNQRFYISLLGLNHQSLRLSSMYPQLNISVADDKYIVSNISQNTLAYKCNNTDIETIFSNNMTISKKCQILTLYTAFSVDNQIATIEEQQFEIGNQFQLYGNYVYRKGDIGSTEQVAQGTVCDFVNYQRFLYEKSLSSDSVSGTVTVIGSIAAAAGAALLKGEL